MMLVDDVDEVLSQLRVQFIEETTKGPLMQLLNRATIMHDLPTTDNEQHDNKTANGPRCSS